MRKISAAVATSVSLLAGTAFAADQAPPVLKAPPLAAPFSWTGFYIGGHAGIAVGVATSSSGTLGAFDDPDFDTITNVPRNVFWGGQVGFNYQIGPAVIGIQGDLGHLGLDATTIRSDHAAEARFRGYATQTGRLGYAFDRTLFYAKGGGAWARISNVAGDLDGPFPAYDPTAVTALGGTRSGWVLGGGVEHALSFAPNWSVKVEYLYMDFGTERTFDTSGFAYDHRNQIHTAKLGVNYRPSWFGAMPASAPIAAPVYNWTGFYIGVNGGYGVADVTTTNAPGFGAYDEGAFIQTNLAPARFFGGAQAGYNWQAGWGVFGIEAEGGYLGMRQEVTAIDDFTRVEFGWYGVLAARAGIALDRTLIYGKFGGAVAHIENTASDLDGVPFVFDPADFSSVTKTRFGWALGGGIEHSFLPNWSLKVEYLYMDFGTFQAFNATPGDVFEHRNTVHTAKLGLNYRFGGATPVVARY